MKLMTFGHFADLDPGERDTITSLCALAQLAVLAVVPKSYDDEVEVGKQTQREETEMHVHS